AALKEFDPVFKANGITLYERLHRPATFIEVALYHIKRALGLGAILVCVVLFLFLFNLRTAFISITAIPLSLLIAVIVMDWRWLKESYRWVLRQMSRGPDVVMGIGLLICVAAIAIIPRLGGEFLPEFREGHFVLQASGIPGTSLREMTRIGTQIEHELLALEL